MWIVVLSFSPVSDWINIPITPSADNMMLKQLVIYPSYFACHDFRQSTDTLGDYISVA